MKPPLPPSDFEILKRKSLEELRGRSRTRSSSVGRRQSYQIKHEMREESLINRKRVSGPSIHEKNLQSELEDIRKQLQSKCTEVLTLQKHSRNITDKTAMYQQQILQNHQKISHLQQKLTSAYKNHPQSRTNINTTEISKSGVKGFIVTLQFLVILCLLGYIFFDISLNIDKDPIRNFLDDLKALAGYEKTQVKK